MTNLLLTTVISETTNLVNKSNLNESFGRVLQTNSLLVIAWAIAIFLALLILVTLSYFIFLLNNQNKYFLRKDGYKKVDSFSIYSDDYHVNIHRRNSNCNERINITIFNAPVLSTVKSGIKNSKKAIVVCD